MYQSCLGALYTVHAKAGVTQKCQTMHMCNPGPAIDPRNADLEGLCGHIGPEGSAM